MTDRRFRSVAQLICLILATFAGTATAIPLELNIERRLVGEESVFTGETNLPDGTKMGVGVSKKGGWGTSDYDVFVKGGRYESKRFDQKGERLVGDYEVEVFVFFNDRWQKPEILKQLPQYTGPAVSDKQIEVTRIFSLYASDEEKKEFESARKKEIDSLGKRLGTLKRMQDQLAAKAKNPKDWSRWSRKWNIALKKEREDMDAQLGDGLPDYKGDCQTSFTFIGIGLGDLISLWGEYDDAISRRKKNGETLKILSEQVEEDIKKAEEGIRECSP